MKLTLAAWHARHRDATVTFTVESPPLDARDILRAYEEWQNARQKMTGPVDPAHDPCGRPPLPPAEETP